MKRNIIKKIRTKKWWLCEGPTVLQFLHPPMIAVTKVTKHYQGISFWGLLVVTKDEYGYQFIDREENLNWTKFLVERNEKNKRYIKNKIRQWRKSEKKLLSVEKEIDKLDLSRIDKIKLFSLFNKFYKALVNAWVLPIILEGNGMYFEEKLIPRVAKESNLKEEKVLEKLSVLVTSEQPSFAKREHSSLLKIALRFAEKGVSINISLKDLRGKHPKLYRDLLNHQKNFFWARNNYKDVRVISVGEFLKEVKAILKIKNRKKIRQEISELENIKKLKDNKRKIKRDMKLSDQLAREVELFSIFSWWMDERKKINIQSNHYLSLLIKEISKRMNISYKDGCYLLNEEIEKFLLGNRKVDLKKLKERRKLAFFICHDNGTYELITGRDAKVYHDEVFKAMKKLSPEKVQEFQGSVACSGGVKRIKGKVNIVLDVKHDKFEKGNILVTSMTRPEFVPLIKKAKAIITNEGGIACHAAIVSRELNIPCIIGTKVATDVLKNGDYVQLDLEKGIVKRLIK